jgi:hypothetical protein
VPSMYHVCALVMQAGSSSSSSSWRALVLTKDHLAIYPGAAAASRHKLATEQRRCVYAPL